MLYLQFIISAGVIIFAGVQLTIFADILSDRLRLGKIWVGVILLGLVTSLPEAVTSLIAVAWLEAPDLGVGNMLGSNSFNIFLLVVMDMVYRGGAVTDKLSYSRSLRPAFWAVLLTAVVFAEMLFGAPVVPGLPLVGMGNVLVILLYFIGIRVLARQGSLEKRVDVKEALPDASLRPLRTIYGYLFWSALFVVLGAVWLVSTAERIAEITGLGQTFFGTMVLACVTSLPEMVVTLSALRLGTFDLAIGNIFGSNMINMFIVALTDIFYTRGPVLRAVSPAHTLTAVLSMAMTVVALTGIRMKDKRTFLGLGWDSCLLLAIFILGMTVLYHIR